MFVFFKMTKIPELTSSSTDSKSGLSISFLARVPGGVNVVNMMLLFAELAHLMKRLRAKPQLRSAVLAKTTCNILKFLERRFCQSWHITSINLAGTSIDVLKTTRSLTFVITMRRLGNNLPKDLFSYIQNQKKESWAPYSIRGLREPF